MPILAKADAFRESFDLSRREALWVVKVLKRHPLPLFTPRARMKRRYRKSSSRNSLLLP